MILRIGNKKIAYSVERIAYSKNKNTFFSFLSAIPACSKQSAAGRRYPLNAIMGRAPNKTLLLNSRFCSGFTLVEVMVATAVLSLGIVLLYEAFFKITDAFGYYSHYLSVSPFAYEKIWAAQDVLSRLGDQATVETSGKLVEKGKDFTWNVSYSLLGEAPDSFLYKIDLVIVWKEGLRKVNLLRSTYALYAEKK